MDPVSAREKGDNFNRYAYAFNNPYRFTDPGGREGNETFGETAAWGGFELRELARDDCGGRYCGFGGSGRRRCWCGCLAGLARTTVRLGRRLASPFRPRCGRLRRRGLGVWRLRGLGIHRQATLACTG